MQLIHSLFAVSVMCKNFLLVQVAFSTEITSQRQASYPFLAFRATANLLEISTFDWRQLPFLFFSFLKVFVATLLIEYCFPWQVHSLWAW